jgi:hypothetical protein
MAEEVRRGLPSAISDDIAAEAFELRAKKFANA